MPTHEARQIDQASNDKLANIKHGYIPDEMPATKHPIDRKYYTSKSKFREVTRSHGYDEVGTAYDNGYEPSKRLESEWKDYVSSIKKEYRERLND